MSSTTDPWGAMYANWMRSMLESTPVPLIEITVALTTIYRYLACTQFPSPNLSHSIPLTIRLSPVSESCTPIRATYWTLPVVLGALRTFNPSSVFTVAANGIVGGLRLFGRSPTYKGIISSCPTWRSSESLVVTPAMSRAPTLYSSAMLLSVSPDRTVYKTTYDCIGFGVDVACGVGVRVACGVGVEVETGVEVGKGVAR